MRRLLVLVVAGALAVSLQVPARAASILFVGNSFTFGELSDVKHYRPESVHDLNNEGIGGVPALFKTFTAQAHLDYEVSLETSAGKNFDFHLQQKAAEINRPWDHVLLQGYSTLDRNKPGDPALLVEADRHGRQKGMVVSVLIAWPSSVFK